MLTARTRREANVLERLAMRTIHGAATTSAPAAAKSVAKAAAALAVGREVVREVAKAAPQLKKSMKSLRGARDIERPMSAPASYSIPMTSAAPSTTFTKNGTRITNRELINGALGGSSTWTLNATYPLNPGIATTFPWLSTLAGKYEQYRFHMLRFIFIPFYSTATSGDIILSADYNPTDPWPLSEVQAVNHPGAIIGAVWQSHIFPCSVKDMFSLGARKFIRTTAVAGDMKTFDCGNFFVSSNNLPGGSTTSGKLFVEYDVEFYVPQLIPVVSSLPQRTTFLTRPTLALTTGVTSAVTVSPGFDPLSCYAGAGAATGTFTLPAGVYLIEFNCYVSDTTNETFSGSVAFFLNGAQYLNDATAFKMAGTASGETMPLSLSSVIPFNGTDTLTVNCNCIGVAGTLSLVNACLTITLA